MWEALRNDSALSVVKRSGVRRIVDKMLFNYNNLGMLHMIYPHAAVIHMMRDPMDTLLSCYRHKFDEMGLRWSLDINLIAEVLC